MVSQCTTINMQEPTNITIQSISIGGIDCPSPTFACTNMICPGGCPVNVDVVVIWANSGDISGTFTPTIQIGIGTPVPGSSIIIPANGTNTSTFSITGLSRGSHNICIDSGTIT